MKKQSAITLIALIITIIIMMILVGVTVTVALNGGLFRTANEAAIKKEIARMQEELFLIRAELKMKNPSNPMPNAGEVLAGGVGIELVAVEVSENAEIISNVDHIPQGSCYKLIPQKLDVSTKRGEGEIEDVFVVDQSFNVYYIVKADNLEPGSTGEFGEHGVSTPNLVGFKIKSSNNKDSDTVSVRYVTYSETGEPIIGDTVDNEPPEDWYEYSKQAYQNLFLLYNLYL